MMDSLKVDRTISDVRVALQSTQRQAIRGTRICDVSIQMANISTDSANSSSGTSSSGTSSGLNVGVNTGLSNLNVGASSSSGVTVGMSSGKQTGNNQNGQGNGVGLATAPGQLKKLDGTSTSGTSSSTTAAVQPITKNSVSGNCLTSGAPDLPENVSMATNIMSDNPTTSTVNLKYGVLGGAEFAIQDPNISTSRDSSGKIVAFVPSQQNPKKKCIAVSSTLGLTRVGTYVGATDPSSITQSGVCTALEWNKQ